MNNILPEGVYETKYGVYELLEDKDAFTSVDGENFYLMMNEAGINEVISDSIIIFEDSYVSNPDIGSTDTSGAFLKPLGTEKNPKNKKKKKYHKKVSIMKRKRSK